MLGGTEGQAGIGDGALGGALSGAQGAGLGGLLGSLGGNGLSGGISELLERFQAAGKGDAAQSWVARGTNQPVGARDLESALGEDTIADLTQATGLSRAELVERLSRNLPETVDSFTPQGRLPTDDETRDLL
jgi:uncharacterized protein YidB (DUF937 family)